MANKLIRVDEARHGLGVFARKRLKAGQIVGEVTGDIHHDPQYSSDYCIDLGNCMALEPDAPMRFLNHACTPNCELILIEDEEQTPGVRVYLETTRNIKAGEQLTIDYAWPPEDTIPCECNSKNCRGWIVEKDQQHLVQG